MHSFVRLPMTFDPEALHADLLKVAPDEWEPHFGTDIYSSDWSGVALRSVSGRADELFPDPDTEAVFSDTEIVTRCAYFSRVMRTFDCEIEAARLLRLGVGAVIAEHTDQAQGYDEGEIRLHIPIATNADVSFIVDHHHLDMRPGEVWYADFTKPHSVANRGNTPRVHLVLDCHLNQWLDEKLASPSVLITQPVRARASDG